LLGFVSGRFHFVLLAHLNFQLNLRPLYLQNRSLFQEAQLKI